MKTIYFALRIELADDSAVVIHAKKNILNNECKNLTLSRV